MWKRNRESWGSMTEFGMAIPIALYTTEDYYHAKSCLLAAMTKTEL